LSAGAGGLTALAEAFALTFGGLGTELASVGSIALSFFFF
jgi:hypothetical protein